VIVSKCGNIVERKEGLVDIFMLLSVGYFALTFLVFFSFWDYFEIVTIKNSCLMLFKNFSLTSISVVYKRDDSMPVRHKFILK
jgi:hypothetical protein